MYRYFINTDLKGLVEQYHITIQNGRLTISCPACVQDSLSIAVCERTREVIFCIRMLQAMQRKTDIEALDGYLDIENSMLALAADTMDLDTVLSAETDRFNRRNPQDTGPYPQTTAFLEALRYSLKPNVTVSEIGHQAVQSILDGEDYNLAIMDMYQKFQVLQNQYLGV